MKLAQPAGKREAGDIDDPKGVRQRQSRIEQREDGDVPGPAAFDHALLKQQRERCHQKVQRIGSQFQRDMDDVVVQRGKQEHGDPARRH